MPFITATGLNVSGRIVPAATSSDNPATRRSRSTTDFRVAPLPSVAHASRHANRRSRTTTRIRTPGGVRHGGRYGQSMPSGSLVQGMRVEASTSPAAQPAMMPAVSAIARTRGKTWAFSGGNCET